MQRRSFLKAAAASAALATPLAAPSVAAAQGSRVLKFIPQSDLTVLDPIWTTAYVTRNHGYMVFDTLFGTDGHFKPSPQMADGMTVENDGKTGPHHAARRPEVPRRPAGAGAGLRGQSIQRWGKRDAFGQTLMATTDELSRPTTRPSSSA